MNTVKAIVLGTAAKLKWLAPLAARLALGYVFVTTGWGKLHHLEQVTQFFQSLGIPAANIQAPFVAAVELVCGAMVLIGLFARIASVPLIGTMVVAIITAKMGDVKDLSDFLQLPEFLMILLFGYLFTFGSGAVSADQFICKDCAGTCSR